MKPRCAIINLNEETAFIRLTHDYETVVDLADADLARFNWSVHLRSAGCSYARRNSPVLGMVSVHRVVMERVLGRELTAGEVVDHINGNGLDNRRSNLRVCNQSENCRNQLIAKNNTSGAKGVFWNKTTGKWTASIRLNYRNIYLGGFSDFNAAVSARHAAELEYYGEFSTLICRNDAPLASLKPLTDDLHSPSLAKDHAS